MADKNRISDSEWKVMNVLWAKPNLTANQIIESLAEENWSPKTVRTLINRLVGKGVLGVDKEPKEHTFLPLIDEDECVKSETKSFFGRIRAKAVKPMLAAFIEQQHLSDDEINELKKILDKKQQESK